LRWLDLIAVRHATRRRSGPSTRLRSAPATPQPTDRGTAHGSSRRSGWQRPRSTVHHRARPSSGLLAESSGMNSRRVTRWPSLSEEPALLPPLGGTSTTPCLPVRPRRTRRCHRESRLARISAVHQRVGEWVARDERDDGYGCHASQSTETSEGGDGRADPRPGTHHERRWGKPRPQAGAFQYYLQPGVLTVCPGG